MKTTEEIIRLLRNYKELAREKYGFTRMGIFGSVARGEQTEQSDVDVCYGGKAPSLITLCKIEEDLETIFGTKVDLVRVRDGMNAILRQRIQKEGIYV